MTLLAVVLLAAVQSASLRVEVQSGGAPVPGAAVILNGAAHETDGSGMVVVPIEAGRVAISVSKAGFVPVTTVVEVAAGEQRTALVELAAEPSVEETVTVSATRTNKRLEDQPMRVEVLGREEIEEKMLMTPGDIVMMLNEMGGMRVQTTSPSLGAASVRVQGMPGRYTRVLSDGLPLYGEQVGGLGLLQIPPMDLGQVEVIKGVASALYGAGAMGGVINLVSRTPGSAPVRELLVNRSTRGATDVVLFGASPLARGWSASLLGSGHWQRQTDVNGDDWSDLSGYGRGVVRPRFFWDGADGRRLFVTAGAAYEDRRGGTMPGAALPQVGGAYVEALETKRIDAGGLGQLVWADRYILSARAAAARQRHAHRFGDLIERDGHDTFFGEATVRGGGARQTWVAGAAIEREAYRPRDLPRFAYTFTVPGVFVQHDAVVNAWLSTSASARVDAHNEYGTFFSPRLSLLVRRSGWTSRVSAGRGFFAPTPLTEETEAAGLSRLQIPRPLVAERGRSFSIDVSRAAGAASITATLFGARVLDPLRVERMAEFVLTNGAGPTRTVGVELLGTWRRERFAATGTYTFVNARETGDAGTRDVPLTPRHSGGLVGVLESEERGRLGLELYYTGIQPLEENPYRARSAPYVIVGVLAERRFGALRLFINGENLGGVRQTRWDALLRPARATDGRWTVDGWAPLEGRVINGGVRVVF
jgi:iron complex outermembrane receptor protein